MKTAHDLYLQGVSLLKHLETPEIESRLLVCQALSISAETFFRDPERNVAEREKQEFSDMLDKRLSGIPLAFILGSKEFWSTSFYVRPGVLIPRPETEFIVEKVIELAGNQGQLPEQNPVVVDVGTGSGCIAVTLGMEFPRARIYATDTSSLALQVAAINADIQDLLNVTFCQGDLFTPLEKLDLQGKCDFIVSNPPYVSLEEWKTLDKEIREHEPKEALVAGETGLEVIEKLVQEAPAYLTPGKHGVLGAGGYLIFEIGYGQVDAVLKLFASKGEMSKSWAEVTCFPDLAGIPRTVVARKR